MNEIDRKILSDLVHNCRLSYEELGRRTGLSPNAVKNRVAHLVESGIVSRFRVILDRGVTGAEFFQAIVLTDGSENVDDFVARMGERPMVGHVSVLACVHGGAYLVWGQYVGSEMLRELAAFLRSDSAVLDVDVQTLFKPCMSKIKTLSRAQLRVLRYLYDDPRMQISDISAQSGLAPKTVRKLLRELEETKAVSFVARPDLAAGGLVNIHLRIEFDESRISIDELARWVETHYPMEFWEPWPLAAHPIMYAEFMVDSLARAETVAKEIKAAPFTRLAATLVSYSSAKFPYLAETKLKDLLDASEQ